jgi:hypothetical protein
VIVDRYYYSQLNEREQAIYKAFYQGVMEHRNIIPIPVKGKITDEVFHTVYLAMTRDNPLIYHLNQSSCNRAEDLFGHTAICPQYFFSKKKVKEYNRKIEKAVNGLAIKLRLTEGTDYEKERKVHDWMCQNIEYDDEGADLNNPTRVIVAHNIIGVFAHHKGQCEGIAKAVKVLLNVVDVKCIVVTGDASGNGQDGPHAWNIVNLNGVPYQMDVTWDIGVGRALQKQIPYGYFNITDEMMLRDHKPDSKLPECNALEENYFTKNKLAFRMRSRLLSYIEKEMNRGRREFYFRVEGRLKQSAIVNDVVNIASNRLAEQGVKHIRMQQIPNDKLGVYWIKVY